MSGLKFIETIIIDNDNKNLSIYLITFIFINIWSMFIVFCKFSFLLLYVIIDHNSRGFYLYNYYMQLIIGILPNNQLLSKIIIFVKRNW